MEQPATSLILRDETGQPWAVTVRPDGQLQTRTATPDDFMKITFVDEGEPMTGQGMDIEELSERLAKEFKTRLR